MLEHGAVLKRIQALRTELGELGRRGGLNGPRQSTITVLELVYGTGSEQVKGFIHDWEPHNPRDVRGTTSYNVRMVASMLSVLASAEADLEAGVTKSRAVLAKGEVLGDFVALARRALDAKAAEADAVAAVLAAASLEDALKQLGESKGVPVVGREMRGTIEKLKGAGLLEGARASIAEGFVTFRNAALHGEFHSVDRAATLSVLSFVEQVLLEEFS